MSVRWGESDRVGGNSHRRMGISTLERLEDRVQVAAHVQLSTWRFSSPLVVPSNQSVPADAWSDSRVARWYPRISIVFQIWHRSLLQNETWSNQPPIHHPRRLPWLEYPFVLGTVCRRWVRGSVAKRHGRRYERLVSSNDVVIPVWTMNSQSPQWFCKVPSIWGWVFVPALLEMTYSSRRGKPSRPFWMADLASFCLRLLSASPELLRRCRGLPSTRASFARQTPWWLETPQDQCHSKSSTWAFVQS